ncbi:type I restriction-modification system subunit M, partial [bacterium]|nr:type I restriction-modification system subunit M [bacterium]
MSNNNAAFIWAVADLLRGDFKQADYGKVILPFTLLRRLDCVLENTKENVLKEYEEQKDSGIPLDKLLPRKSGYSFFNTSKMDFTKLLDDSDNIANNLISYIHDYSGNARDIFSRYEFENQIQKLDEANLLYMIVQKFSVIDLHPDKVNNNEMGHMFEELIRKFAELSNETAGEHFTPREVIQLMVNLLFISDDEALRKPGVVRSIYDPAAGTGGMLSIAAEHLFELNPDAKLVPFGQELNGESYAICKADMLIKGEAVENIMFGNTMSEDGHPARKFDYMLSNPPFGVEWKKVQKTVVDEHTSKGYAGRFGPGLPRV